MKRRLFPITMVIIIAAALLTVSQVLLAQVPMPTPLGQEPPPAISVILPTIVVPTVGAPAVVTPTPDTAPVNETLPTDSDVLTILINARTDLEILANQQLGGVRPQGWSGSLDINNPDLPVLIRLDLEVLMGTLLGVENIPDGWFGAVPSTPYAIARDIRHDLELLADVTIQPSVRPPGWAGDDALMRCNRSTQSMMRILERNGLFVSDADPAHPLYCQLVETQLGQYAEVNLLHRNVSVQSGATSSGGTTTGGSSFSGSATALENVGHAFLDRYATQLVGIIPTNVSFTPVARSFTQFSRMTLVRGDGFEVLVDYKSTTIPAQTFATLPNVNDIGINAVCAASWCKPVTFIPGIGSGGRRGGLASTGLVNAGSNMIIYYDGEDTEGMTKVRMELCDRPTSTNEAICEPVTEVILPDGSPSLPVGTLGGFQQFYVPYSYTTTSVYSRNFFTVDLWIDPPSQRN